MQSLLQARDVATVSWQIQQNNGSGRLMHMTASRGERKKLLSPAGTTKASSSSPFCCNKQFAALARGEQHYFDRQRGEYYHRDEDDAV
ncbi:hypothetical protein TRIATDRAFT_298525 [Trichoderma atroviride IMI 206040]|uniref:Uncharacterized protein n=1 Tax=Hypocrea atroviridis (strain ATCC 20476 / IMI 206040) TaxID=452589 RepID=G9NP99_HYPAI|nr:uncharacterized protein TRIATDRAFT_298525 [Trichoderma atroviride IMI 206040]EHK47371.1 hypothetical protein TRIATDRAFT_298525 [Trichoderma atroviride IMI 206040]